MGDGVEPGAARDHGKLVGRRRGERHPQALEVLADHSGERGQVEVHRVPARHALRVEPIQVEHLAKRLEVPVGRQPVPEVELVGPEELQPVVEVVGAERRSGGA